MKHRHIGTSAHQHIILGIDPGSHTTGYGIISAEGSRLLHIDNGLIVPPARASMAERLVCIHHALVECIARYCPTVVAIEEIFFAKNAKSALVLGQARGVAILAAAQAALPVHEYATRQVKQCVVGNGNATKTQIQFMTRQLLKLPEIAAEDAADALAVALTHVQMRRML